MLNPSPGNSITLRVEAPSSFGASQRTRAAVGATGAATTARISPSHITPGMLAAAAEAIANRVADAGPNAGYIIHSVIDPHVAAGVASAVAKAAADAAAAANPAATAQPERPASRATFAFA